MGIFDKIKNKVQQTTNQSFLNAVVAGCVMVAYADGNVNAEEKSKILGAIKRDKDLSCYPESLVSQKFEEFVDHMDFDVTLGTTNCMTEVKKIASNQKDCEMCVAILCAVGRADGDFSREEKMIVGKICDELRVQKRNYNL